MNEVYYHVYQSTHWETKNVTEKEQLLIRIAGTDMYVDGWGSYPANEMNGRNIETIILERIGTL